MTLEIDEVVKEARHLADQDSAVCCSWRASIRNLFLRITSGAASARFATLFPAWRWRSPRWRPKTTFPWSRAGAEALIVYQETYNVQPICKELHVAGPKKDFLWRLDCPERAYAAGFRRIGVGALFGLAPWKEEARALAAHLEYLQKTCWQAQFTVSLPRMRPAAGEFQPAEILPDREFIQLLCAFRIAFPHAGLILSTREPAVLRDILAPLGITHMSAGSHTEPGGYTGQGLQNVHQTVKGRQIAAGEGNPEAQFSISDERTPAEVAERLRTLGLDPVWKDWDAAILAAA